MSRLLLFRILLAVLPALPAATADMGQISVYDARVSESAQKAIILHNGTEEVLILGTDLNAERDTAILRFIPFPAEPRVSLAPAGAFEAAAALLQKHRLRFLVATKGGAPDEQPVELRLHQKLGAHDLTVIKVNDALQFRAWVNAYLENKKLPVQASHAVAEGIVADYVQRGINYFALDFVELTKDTRFIEPVAYRFASRELYYPLKTSNSFGGTGEIDLILLLPGSLCTPSLAAHDTCLGFRAGPVRNEMQASTSAAVALEDIVPLYPEAAKFFGGKPVFMQMASWWGDYRFDRDIFADPARAVPRAYGYDEKEAQGPGLELIENVIPGLDEKPSRPAAAPDPRCALHPDPGPCKGLFRKFHFDPAKGACAVFFYGGCQGVVPFETREACEAACVKNAGERH